MCSRSGGRRCPRTELADIQYQTSAFVCVLGEAVVCVPGRKQQDVHESINVFLDLLSTLYVFFHEVVVHGPGGNRQLLSLKMHFFCFVLVGGPVIVRILQGAAAGVAGRNQQDVQVGGVGHEPHQPVGHARLHRAQDQASQDRRLRGSGSR